MSYYQLFQQGAAVYVPVLLISLLITIIAYGLFPIGFAKLRKKPIKSHKYTLLCYGVNIVVSLVFAAFGSSGGAYILWTWVFSALGKRKLLKKGLLITKTNSHYFSENTREVSERKENFDACGKKSGVIADTDADAVISQNLSSSRPKAAFCRKCGFKLLEGSKFCSSCGTAVVEDIKNVLS